MTHDHMSDREASGRRDSGPAPSPAAEELASEVASAEAQADEAAAAFEHDVDALLVERNDLLELSQRLQADFENYRKRMIREQTAMVERATEGLVEQLLPVLDSFEAAFGHLDGGAATVDPEAVRKGVSLVHDQLRDVLTRAGLEVVDATGVPFDPHEHEAVLQEPGDGDPAVGEVMRAGYRLRGRVLRPAMVKVVHGVDAAAVGSNPTGEDQGS